VSPVISSKPFVKFLPTNEVGLLTVGTGGCAAAVFTMGFSGYTNNPAEHKIQFFPLTKSPRLLVQQVVTNQALRVVVSNSLGRRRQPDRRVTLTDGFAPVFFIQPDCRQTVTPARPLS